MDAILTAHGNEIESEERTTFTVGGHSIGDVFKAYILELIGDDVEVRQIEEAVLSSKENYTFTMTEPPRLGEPNHFVFLGTVTRNINIPDDLDGLLAAVDEHKLPVKIAGPYLSRHQVNTLRNVVKDDAPDFRDELKRAVAESSDRIWSQLRAYFGDVPFTGRDISILMELIASERNLRSKRSDLEGDDCFTCTLTIALTILAGTAAVSIVALTRTLRQAGDIEMGPVLARPLYQAFLDNIAFRMQQAVADRDVRDIVNDIISALTVGSRDVIGVWGQARLAARMLCGC